MFSAMNKNWITEKIAPTNKLKASPIKTKNFMSKEKIRGVPLLSRQSHHPKKTKSAVNNEKDRYSNGAEVGKKIRIFEAMITQRAARPSKPSVEGLAKLLLVTIWVRLPERLKK